MEEPTDEAEAWLFRLGRDANDPNRGFDAQTLDYVDMLKAGIIADPRRDRRELTHVMIGTADQVMKIFIRRA